MLNNNHFLKLIIKKKFDSSSTFESLLNQINPNVQFNITADTDKPMSVKARKCKDSDQFLISEQQSDENVKFLQFGFFDNNNRQITADIPFDEYNSISVDYIYLDEEEKVTGIFTMDKDQKQLNKILSIESYEFLR